MGTHEVIPGTEKELTPQDPLGQTQGVAKTVNWALNNKQANKPNSLSCSLEIWSVSVTSRMALLISALAGIFCGLSGISHNNKFWVGLFFDLAIEQIMMHSI